MSTKTETELIDSAGGARSEPGGRAQRPAGAARPPQGPPPLELPGEVRDRLADEVIDELLAGARSEEEIVGPGGVLAQLTKRLVERAMSAELTEHLGYEPHQEPVGCVNTISLQTGRIQMVHEFTHPTRWLVRMNSCESWLLATVCLGPFQTDRAAWRSPSVTCQSCR